MGKDRSNMAEAIVALLRALQTIEFFADANGPMENALVRCIERVSLQNAEIVWAAVETSRWGKELESPSSPVADGRLKHIMVSSSSSTSRIPMPTTTTSVSPRIRPTSTTSEQIRSMGYNQQVIYPHQHIPDHLRVSQDSSIGISPSGRWRADVGVQRPHIPIEGIRITRELLNTALRNFDILSLENQAKFVWIAETDSTLTIRSVLGDGTTSDVVDAIMQRLKTVVSSYVGTLGIEAEVEASSDEEAIELDDDDDDDDDNRSGSGSGRGLGKGKGGYKRHRDRDNDGDQSPSKRGGGGSGSGFGKGAKGPM